MVKLILVLLATLCARSQARVELNDFIPWGVDVGDIDLRKSGQTDNFDDGSSEEIHLIEPFQFFGQVHRSLWVNINGAVSFNKPIPTYTPNCDALGDDMSMISPFWADVDIRMRGKVYFRQSQDRKVLDRARQEILAGFPNIADTDTELGIMKWALVATWEDVPFYDDMYCNANYTNTFQLILATDEIYSFAIFFYNKIEWTTGSASGADGCTGRGGKPARAGFDNGKGIMEVLYGSCTGDIRGVSEDTMGLTPGKFVFRVDDRSIIAPGSSTLRYIANTTPSPPTVEPTTTSTSTPTTTGNSTTTTTSDDFKEHYDHTKNDLEHLDAECAHLCPGLIDHPALQDECFEMWKKVENLIDELYLTRKDDELEQIELEVHHIARVLQRIQDDIA